MPAAPDSTDWTARLTEALDRSVEHAEEVITRHPDIQGWLRRGSLEAAMETGSGGGLDAASAAYGYLLDNLRERFPALTAAVRDVTGGCAALDVQWRPLNPSYSRIRLDFGTDFRVHVFRSIQSLDDDAAQEALDAVARELPRGMPFAGRPNEANGVIAHDDRCAAVRVRETQRDGARRRSVTLQTGGRQSAEEVAPEEASRQLVRLLRPAGPGSDWIDAHR